MKILLNNNRTIKITPHGRKRLNERVHTTDFYKSLIKDAYEKGDDLDDDEIDTMFKRGMYKEDYWGSIYKKYLGRTFIFRNRNKDIIFITVI